MVRLLTGSMVRCAQGKADARWLQELLTPGVGRKSSFAAPAEGLYLEKVLYRFPRST
jgi:tRNA U38,U39,U40 pseudouridine synthase TruA